MLSREAVDTLTERTVDQVATSSAVLTRVVATHVCVWQTEDDVNLNTRPHTNSRHVEMRAYM